MRRLASIRATRAALRERSETAVALMERCLRQQDAHAGALNVFASRVARDVLLEQAEHVDRVLDRGGVAGPLAGIPIALKDVFLTADMPTTASSAVLENYRSDRDASVVTRLRQAGAIIVGKAQTHEFAYGTTNDNIHAGPSRNPWDPERVPGGSSGGSAIAVATGMCLGATGTDTGGSIRTPSGLCGITGLKPTYGLVSRRGVLPLSWSLDHVGPMARSVDDVAFLLGAMTGHDPAEPGSAGSSGPDYPALVGNVPERLRIGIPQDYFLDVIDPEVRAAFDAAVSVLEELGWSVQPVRLPSLTYALGAELAILSAEASAYHKKTMSEKAALYSRDVRIELDAGMMISAGDYLLAQRARRLIVEELSGILRAVDLLVVPTLPVTAPKLGAATIEVGGAAMPTPDVLWRNVFPFNLTGVPALSVPCGFSRADLPIGMQMIAGAFRETLLLQAGHAYQQACDWHLRLPPLHRDPEGTDPE